MKKLSVLLLSAVLAFVLIFGCAKKSSTTAPAEDATLTPSITATTTTSDTATDTPTFTQTFTATQSPTTTETLTPSPTPLLIDNFEDGNFYNEINAPMFNQWVEDKNSTSFTSTFALSSSGPYGGLGSFCLGITGTAVTEIPDGAGSYYGYIGMKSPLLNGSGNGINAVALGLTTLRVTTTLGSANTGVVYRIKLSNALAQYIYSDISAQADWIGYGIGLDGFLLPSGATYTRNDVISNITEFSIIGIVTGSPAGLSADIHIHVDVIKLD